MSKAGLIVWRKNRGFFTRRNDDFLFEAWEGIGGWRLDVSMYVAGKRRETLGLCLFSTRSEAFAAAREFEKLNNPKK